MLDGLPLLPRPPGTTTLVSEMVGDIRHSKWARRGKVQPATLDAGLKAVSKSFSSTQGVCACRPDRGLKMALQHGETEADAG